MTALFTTAALAVFWAQSTLAFIPIIGYDTYRDVRQNYHEIMTHCEREGGECIDVDVSTQETPAPTMPPTAARIQPPVVPTEPFFYFPFIVTAPFPQPTTRTPRPTTIPTLRNTRAAVTTNRQKDTPALLPPRAGKVSKGKQKGGRNAEYEPLERRKRRQAYFDPYHYLYSECNNGWEFDLGCGVKGNICCYKSSSSSY